MRDETRAAREAEILEAAFAELLEKGYRGTTMLAVARRAAASKETLYAWYGDKCGLFRALVTANAAAIEGFLAQSLTREGDSEAALRRMGALLLALLLGERAVAINRAAAADVAEGGALGQALAEGGRERILPLIRALLRRARKEGLLAFEADLEVAEVYLGLLLGDLQVRRIIGVAKEPGTREMEQRAARAVLQLRRLYEPERGTA